MLHRPLRLGCIALLLSVIPLASVTPPSEAASSRPFAAPAMSQTVDLAFGERETIQIPLTNTQNTTITPIIREAYPPVVGLAAASAPTGPSEVSLPAQDVPIDPALLETLDTPADTAEMLLYLADQADLSAAYRIADWNERGRYVVETLQRHATRTQAALLADLRERGIAATSYWAVNAVRIYGTSADAARLADRADVALVRANTPYNAPQAAPVGVVASVDASCNPDGVAGRACWNVRKVGANTVWSEFGVDGTGITVANIDTGVAYQHESLRQQYRGTRPDGTFDHTYSWFDPQGTAPAPVDQNGHGTHTMGTIVGAKAGGLIIGAAPGARWIAAQGCESNACTESDLIASAQWLLAPKGPNDRDGRPQLRPMIINNSWGGDGGDDWYNGYVAAWRASGIFPVFAAGNVSPFVGQECGSISSPGDYEDVIAVGATNAEDRLAEFSLLGPAKGGETKPDIMAPGTYYSGSGILSASPAGATSYQQLQGTSMATPLVSAAVALLMSADPTLIGQYDRTKNLLLNHARAIADDRCGGTPDDNNIYGKGRLDILASVRNALVDIPWIRAVAPGPIAPGQQGMLNVTIDSARMSRPGTFEARIQLYSNDLTQPPTTLAFTVHVTGSDNQKQLGGRVISALTGSPLAAIVRVDGGAAVETDSNGQFAVVVTEGQHELDVSAIGHVTTMVQIDTATSGDLLPDIVLAGDIPRLSILRSPEPLTVQFGQRVPLSFALKNTGSRPLPYTVSLAGLPLQPAAEAQVVPGPMNATLQPESAITIPLLVPWVRPDSADSRQRTYQITVESGDPIMPRSYVLVDVTMELAPYTVHVPVLRR